jgi:hypothetical protein
MILYAEGFVLKSVQYKNIGLIVKCCLQGEFG